jgi:hypothetical protein
MALLDAQCFNNANLQLIEQETNREDYNSKRNVNEPNNYCRVITN